MAPRARFFPRYRTVRVVPWWAPAIAPAGLALLIVWVLGMLWLLLGAPGIPR